MNDLDDEILDKTSFAYRDIRGRDRWDEFTPVRVGWTDVGTPTVVGRLRIVGRQCFAQVLVTPGTTCATTAGTSFINLPIAAAGYAGGGVHHDHTTGTTLGVGVRVSTSVAAIPTLAATAAVRSISFWYEING